ncbi:MAG: hypothetical protein EOO41_00540, partial [Methanobacteriota archaeon]
MGALLALARAALWRTSKKYVLDDLGMPPVMEEDVRIALSRIERACYNRQQQQLVEHLRTVVTRWRTESARAKQLAPSPVLAAGIARGSVAARLQEDGIISLDTDDEVEAGAAERAAAERAAAERAAAERAAEPDPTLDVLLTPQEQLKLLQPLVSLRRACVHPQLAGRGGAAPAGRRAREHEAAHAGGGGEDAARSAHDVQPMERVLNDMIVRATLDCEEDLRTIVWCWNGLAGLYYAADQRRHAAFCYAQVLAMAAPGYAQLQDEFVRVLKACMGDLRMYLTRESLSAVHVDKLQVFHAAVHLHTLLTTDQPTRDDIAAAVPTPLPVKGGLAPAWNVHAIGAVATVLGRAVMQLASEYMKERRAAVQVAFSNTRASNARVRKQLARIPDSLLALEDDAARAVGGSEPVPAAASLGESLNESMQAAACDTAHEAAAATGAVAGPASSLSPIEGEEAAHVDIDTMLQLSHGIADAQVERDLNAAGACDAVLETTLRQGLQTALDTLPDTNFALEQALLAHARGDAVVNEMDLDNNPALEGRLPHHLVWAAESKHDVASRLLRGVSDIVRARQRARDYFRRCLSPSASDVLKTLDCSVCHAEWKRKGPPCEHCKAGLYLTFYCSQFRGNADSGTDTTAIAITDTKSAAAAVAAMRSKGPRKSRKVQLMQRAARLELLMREGETMEADKAQALLHDLVANRITQAFEKPTAFVRCATFLARRVHDAQRGGVDGAQHASILGDVLQTLLDELQTEAHNMHSVWSAQGNLLNAFAELKSSLLRMRMVPDGYVPDDGDADAAQLNVSRQQWAWQAEELRETYEQAVKAFQRSAGSLRYTMGIRNEEAASDLCPVCCDVLGGESGDIVFLSSCRHRLCCLSDWKDLQRMASGRGFHCLICRHPYDPRIDVQFVNSKTPAAVCSNTGHGNEHGGVGCSNSSGSDGSDGSDSSSAAATTVVMKDERGVIAPAAVEERWTSWEQFSFPTRTLAAASSWVRGELPPSAFPDVLRAFCLPTARTFGAKINTLIRCLRVLRGSTADVLMAQAEVAGARSGDALRAVDVRPLQSIVFSQWDDALLIVEAALKSVGIKCLRVTGTSHAASAVTSFMADSSIQVLLMSFKTGAEGLNITCASHVFLMEPLLTPAVEQQAIGRVFRFGQARQVHVHRFIAMDTVE